MLFWGKVVHLHPDFRNKIPVSSYKTTKMRKLILLAFALFVTCITSATVINRQQAAERARDFMAKNFRKKSVARRAVHTISLNTVETGQSLVYAFNVEGGGYVVVAGDDCAPAILGFSETSTIDPQDIPDGMKYFFEQYQQEMQFMIQNGLRAGAVASLGAEVKPLMACKWGQGAPYNYTLFPQTITITR